MQFICVLVLIYRAWAQPGVWKSSKSTEIPKVSSGFDLSIFGVSLNLV